MKKSDPQPPRWTTSFLRWYCRPRLLEDLEGDLYEYFERNVRQKGIARARLIYFLDVIKFMRPYTIRKIEPLTFLTHFMMIGSYFKTSRRNLVRNKLFSFINIVGLAVSMSVGLLVIAIVNDLRSYDDFHEKKDRIYRINTHHQADGREPMNLASTSARIAQRLAGDVPGIEDFTIIRNGFSEDAKIGQNTFPLEATWADGSFFKVVTFPLIAGDPATALKEPYSLVLTEKTALKFFGTTHAVGQTVRLDTLDYQVTGVARDVPHLSHIHFDALVSFATAEALFGKKGDVFNNWDNVWSNYVYIAVPKGGSTTGIQRALDQICREENKALVHQKVTMSLQPFKDIALGRKLSNNMGPRTEPTTLWILGGLAFVIILSACFNYTNLSVARSLRRSREVGVRKIIGARGSHVLGQFMAESVIIAFLALLFSFGLYLLVRREFLALDPHISEIFRLDLSFRSVLYFIALALFTGLAAGFLPAVFFSKINALAVMKDASGIKIFRHIGLRRVLIVTQYALSLIFIATTVVGYGQYKGFLNFDLGFNTGNILNIKLRGVDAEVLKKELAEIPGVKQISHSSMVTSVGSIYGFDVKYFPRKDAQPADSGLVWVNTVDEHYLPIHQHKLLAGNNFTLRPEKGSESELIVNQQVLKRFNIGNQDPHKALGQIIEVNGQKLTIIGVLKDFHYGTMENKIEPAMLRYSRSEPWGYLNLQLATNDLENTMAKIESAWKRFDRVHPLKATFYDDQIQEAYSQFSVMVKAIGFLAFLAICIASLGLFGMVVFTTETKLKEISIRKVLGASEPGLIYLLCRGFITLLGIAALIALPATYLLFDKLLLTRFAYHQPIGLPELLGGALVVMLLALIMIGSQTAKAARSNPAKVLKSE
ncbi:MacB-like core domain-containing protein [Dyadobacter soli]|uniref:MacB-like core domain-containing protein n=1 Tax=Dyadobacter soli TaxID=659014 RepID=A0A1G7FTJ6_9BACT|nr:ABC transporter permease [Dyadobacter soli]SDE79223.1 MacB-like core domain-containing protein [Dyadobacter soli]